MEAADVPVPYTGAFAASVICRKRIESDYCCGQKVTAGNMDKGWRSMIVLKNEQVRFHIKEEPYQETIEVFNGQSWTKVFRTIPYASEVSDDRKYNVYFRECRVLSMDPGDRNVHVVLEHPDYMIDRLITLDDSDLLHFRVRLTARKDLRLRAIEDKWELLTGRNHTDSPQRGPLDFVWSQRLKMLPACFVSHYNFRTPVQIFQQKGYCLALIAGLEDLTREEICAYPPGFDMNVTEEERPWMSYGIITALHMTPDWPGEAGHSMIIRGASEEFVTLRIDEGESAGYRYTIQAFFEPGRTGYQRVLRGLWRRYYDHRLRSDHGQPAVNPRFPDVKTYEDWEEALLEKKLVDEYFTDEAHPECGGVRCFRQGDWFSRTDYQHDVWYACWLQELVTGYGMYLYDKRSDRDFKGMAERILNFILSAPRQKDGLFPCICYVEEDGSRTWLNDDGWAGYYKDYHAMMMSWNGYLMLLWGRELFPEREQEIMAFLEPYARFLVKAQLASGNIPAWYGEDGKPSKEQLRRLNAETAISAAFLLEMGNRRQDEAMMKAARKAMAFLEREILPRHRWFDMETFKSCSQKDFSFYDGITAQYPQCNLSMIYAVIAYLKQYELEPGEENLGKLCRMMDYLLLYQQLWNHPDIECDVFGGFTVQNGDNEWSDIREGIVAVLLYRCYEISGNWEYMERGVAAMQSCFPPLPFENWAHCGYEGMQYDSSLLWGGGVAMTAGEYYKDRIGDAAFDLETGKGICFFGTYAPVIREEDGVLCITAEEACDLHTVRIFHATGDHAVRINGRDAGVFTGKMLEEKICLKS